MTRSRVLPTALALTLAVTGLAAGCGGTGDEQGITIYSGRIAPLVGPLIDQIEAREGVDIQTRFGETPQLAVTLIEEGENSPADVFFAQDAGALGALRLARDCWRSCPTTSSIACRSASARLPAIGSAPRPAPA